MASSLFFTACYDLGILPLVLGPILSFSTMIHYYDAKSKYGAR
jgi:hypothetical protein